MKRTCIIFLSLFIIVGCIGCTPKTLTPEITVPPENYAFYYAKDGKIASTAKNTQSSYLAIMEEWLTFNSLDTRFKLNRVFMYSENPDLMPETEKNEYIYIWDENMVFCFLSDFDAFINDESNLLYKQALDMTLRENRDIMLANALAEDSQR
ncbi:MAG: hypothetical protein IJY08_05690 [Clostridia bacterium]|nr:hypothetical protein [Clostridia bacterium]